MGRRDAKPPEESPGGAPKWMVTFSDCMTLLLTFFVLLLTFSSFDDKSFRKFTTALALANPASGDSGRQSDALRSIDPVRYQAERKKGSEKLDLDGREEANINEAQSYRDYEHRRVYLVRSDAMFLGLGAELSQEGQDLLANLAVVIGDMANHIVVSEYQRPGGRGADRLGLRRAWAVTRFLTQEQNVDARRFAIAAAPTVPSEGIPRDVPNLQHRRRLEISILDKRITQ